MIHGALFPVASLATTVASLALLLLAVVTAVLSVTFFRRARSREALAPVQQAAGAEAISEMRAIGDRIETLVSQQQLQGETQRQRLGQQIDEVRQVVSQQGHRVDGLRGELHHEMQKRDHEIEQIRQQLTAIQRSGAALPAGEAAALPPALPAPDEAPAAPPAPPPAAQPEPVSSGDSFAGVEALPPPAPSFRPVAERPQDVDAPEALGAPPEPEAPRPGPSRPAVPDENVFVDEDFFAAEPFPGDAFQMEPTALAPVAPEASSPEPDAPPAYASVFSDMGFDALSPGEPAAPSSVDAWDVEPAPTPTASTPPPDGGAWVSSQREAPDVPVFSSEAWPAPIAAAEAPAEAPAAPFTPPDGADDFRFISTVTEDVQRALYLAGVTKLEEIAHWSRSDARRISAEVGVSEDTIMNQWVFEAQGALFERYSSHVGG